MATLPELLKLTVDMQRLGPRIWPTNRRPRYGWTASAAAEMPDLGAADTKP